MRKIFRLVGMMAGVMAMVTSCLNSDDIDVAYYDDVAVTGFYITSAEVECHTTSSTGEDSTYIETNTDVADITFQIDHYAGRIYNVDSLPYGTNMEKLLCSYSTKNNGILALLSLENEDEWNYFSTTDSIDFTTPRKVRVYAYNDRELTREYTIEVNVKKSSATSMVWTKAADIPSELASMKFVKLLACGNGMTLLASDGVSTSIYRYDGEMAECRFEKLSDDGAAGMYANAVAYGNAMAVLNGTNVEYMEGGTSVTEVHPAENIKQLLTMGRYEICAMSTDGKIVVSADHGATWKEDICDDDMSLLPDKNIAAITVPYSYNGNVDRAILLGSRSSVSDSYMQSWLKVTTGSSSDKWVALTANENTSNYLPTLSSVAIAASSSAMLFATGIGSEGTYNTLYISRDGGLTWKTSDDYTLPPVVDTAECLTMCMDSNNVLWAICGGTSEMWQCKISE